jgi:hypothetical protein
MNLITEKQETDIRNLWSLGHASGSISTKLKIPERYVRRFLKDNKLSRTIEESRNIRKKSGVPYFVNVKEDEILPTVEEVVSALDSTENLPQAAHKLGITTWKLQRLKRMYVIRIKSYKSASIYENMDTADGLSKQDIERALEL